MKVQTILLCVLPLLFMSCTNKYENVKTGLDVLIEERLDLLQEKQIGIITNQTAVNRQGEHIVDLLLRQPDISIRALFAPEHGIRGDREGGAYIESYVDSLTGITVYSLYGKAKKPSPEMLDSIDVLLFDIQDIGARFYTYISTMGLAMEAAAERGIPFIVLDRPNPITGEIVEGPVLKPEFKSFVGMYPIPIRHGMTIGELAMMINGEGWLKSGLKAELTVIPMRGWTRMQWFDQTGLPWINPSPNIPDLTSALLYPGIALLEGVNVSEGRGTSTPFQLIGAPWIDASALKNELSDTWIYGIELKETRFTPVSIPGTVLHPEYEDELCNALKLEVYDRQTFRAVSFGVYLCCALQRLFPDRVQFRPGFQRLIGDDRVLTAILAGEKPNYIIASWENDLRKFLEIRKKYLLYPEK